jgi:hypothetical protein
MAQAERSEVRFCFEGWLAMDLFHSRDNLDDYGIPTHWDDRKRLGVCLAVGCPTSAQGVVPGEGGVWAHDCPCCLAHCEAARHDEWLAGRL